MARMFTLRPRSITGLLLSGFGLVALPLIIAAVYGVVYVDRLTNQSERLVLQGVKVTRTSRRLLNVITDMERNARQYAVIADPKLAASFAENHEKFQNDLADLQHLSLNTVADWKLDELAARGEAVADAVDSAPLDAPRLESQLETFDVLRQQAKAIIDEGNLSIDNELKNLQATSRRASRFLVLSVFAVLPAVIFLVLVFTALISRPIHQIRAAIRQLGEGDLENPVAISAPTAELDAIGTQLDWLRRRLSELESEKNQFLRQMSHELKTPLASIREGVELMRDGTLGELSDRQAEVVEILQENSLELLALIENLLNFAAWQQHRSKLDYSRFALDTVASEVVQRHSLTIERKKLQIRPAYETCHLMADRDQMRLLFDNLITNAIKYSPVGGIIHIDITCSSATVSIRIADEGPGIPEQEREHVFNPFYQSTLPARSHVQGTGIGLSVVREVARAHGGGIHVIDHARARGACLEVTLPLNTETT